MFKNRLDLHTHSDNSPDGKHNTMLLCEYAVQNKLRAIAVTDHCECNAYFSGRYHISTRQAFFEVNKAKAVFAGKLVVLVGVELGQPLQDLKAAETVLKNQYDFVLASLHNLSGTRDFYYLDYSLEENDPETLLCRYFDELLDIARWGNFDSMAHITYPLRYIPGGPDFDLTGFSDKIDSLLKILAENEKALEINTSGLRQELGRTMPDLDMVRRFKELGGKYITIGSDAHTANDVGRDIDEGMELALKAGFQHVTLFQNRTPIEIPIE